MRGSYWAVATAGADALEDAGAACGTEPSWLSAGAGPGSGPCGGAGFPAAGPGGGPCGSAGLTAGFGGVFASGAGTLAACGPYGWAAPGGAGGG